MGRLNSKKLPGYFPEGLRTIAFPPGGREQAIHWPASSSALGVHVWV